jgi:RNA recognition motif-containing protein
MSKEYTPLVVARSFTKQYYEILHNKPQQLYRFYKEESNFFHGDENQTTETIAGGESIREKVESLNLAGAKVDLTNGSLDAQRSDNNAVFLVVTGKFTMPGRCPRPFVQSFLLVSQSGKPDAQPSYYVRNSVFRLFGDDVAAPPKVKSEPVVTTAVFEKTEEVPVVEPVKEEKKEEKEAEISSEEDDKVETPVVETSTEDIDMSTVTSEPDYVNVSVKNETASVETTVESAPKDVKEANEEPIVVKEKTKPASWACLFAGGSPEPVQEDTKLKKVAPIKQKEPVATNDKVSSSTNKSAGPPRTLYLCQLPAEVVETDVKELFESYGTIKKIDVHAHKGFAFVDFADASSVKKAMQNNGNFVIRGTTIQVEERQTKGSAGSKNGNNNRGGRGAGGSNGGNRQNGNGQKGGDKKQGDNKGGNNNNRNKAGNKAGNLKQSNNAK